MMRERVIKSILDGVNSCSEESIGVELPDGRRIPEGRTDHTVVFRTKKALLYLLKDIEMGFGEGYMKGEIEVEGDLERVLIAGAKYLMATENQRPMQSLLLKTISKIGAVRKVLDRKNVQHHYDLGNDFYSLWLDSSMTYSCAFFPHPDADLETAQREKRKIIYEKLLLRDGDRLLDIGCGWGSVILESAQLFDIKAVGITLSENQYSFVKRKIKDLGLEGRVEVHLMHYADLKSLGMKFNKIVSVGMFEHVGRENYRLFFSTVKEVLEEGGLFLLHTIGKVNPGSQSRWIRKYIFPGGYLPAISEVLEASKGLGFCLIDIDNWRPHYYRTLKEWRKRFWQNREKVIARYGETFFRMWDLYLTSSAVSFYIGSNHLFQFLFSKGVKNDYPIMRRSFSEVPLLCQ